MRFRSALATAVALAAVGGPAAAQPNPRIVRLNPGFDRDFTVHTGARAAVGITTSSGSTVRDTLGVLVSSVYAGSPAEKAGIEEGNRIASVNGVSLKLAAADVGDDAMAGVMGRRLVRELERLNPGDDVDLRVYANGTAKSVKVKTVESGELYRSRVVTRWDDRATLGLSFAVTGSTRDTIGVFVFGVDEGGPAAKAGIEEGNRIASINGVDVRARRGDEEDGVLRTAGVSRLEREIGRLKAGDEADLRVYSNGQIRSVKVKSVNARDLPRRRPGYRIIGGDNLFITPNDFHLSIDGAEIGENVRRAMERAMDGAGRGMEVLGATLDAVGRGIGRTRIVW